MSTLILALALPPAHAGVCRRDTLSEVVSALGNVGADQQVALAATGVAEASCGPAGLLAAARDLPMLPPEMRHTIDMQAATTEPLAWIAACPGGLPVLIELAQVTPTAKSDVVWNGCKLGDRGWFDRDEWNAATGTVVLSIGLGHHLEGLGVPRSDVSVIVRALAGIGGAARTRDDLPELLMPLEELLMPPEELWMPPERMPRLDGGVEGGILEESHPGQPVQGGVLGGLFEAGFADGGRVVPDWSRKATKEGGRCRVEVEVGPRGKLRNYTFLECPDALRPDIEDALTASVLAPVSGTFVARYRVKP